MVLEQFEQRLYFNGLISGPAHVAEGSPYSLNLNIPPQSGASWEISWGDGLWDHNVSGLLSQIQHTYKNGTTTPTINAWVTGVTNPMNTSFGPQSTGVVETDLGTASDSANRVVQQADGKILVAGGPNFSVTRYNTDGTLDTTFGTNGSGKVTIAGTDEARGLAVQSDGKILVGGGSSFVLCRLNSDGTLDTTFGMNGFGQPPDINSNFIAYDMAVAASGKIVMVGTNGFDFAVLRMNSDGTQDRTFGGKGGVRLIDFAGSGDTAYAVGIQGDGKIVVTGQARINGTNINDIGLARLTVTGALDTTFGGSGTGKISTDAGHSDDAGLSLAILSSGKILVGGRGGSGSTGYDYAVARYNSDGTLDATFGSNGKTLVDFGNGSNDQAYSLQALPNGKILLAGRSVGTGYQNFTLARLTGEGALDTTFGNGGLVNTDFGGSDDSGSAMIIQDTGRSAVVVGHGHSGATSTDFVVVDYHIIDEGGDGNPPSGSQQVTVDNVAPTLTAPAGHTVSVGALFTVPLFTFTDPAAR